MRKEGNDDDQQQIRFIEGYGTGWDGCMLEKRKRSWAFMIFLLCLVFLLFRSGSVRTLLLFSSFFLSLASIRDCIFISRIIISLHLPVAVLSFLTSD